jgi:hypothetical protein
MITYSLATPADDEALRSLLRDNPMLSWVSMAATREPSFFAGSNYFGRDWAVIAREDSITVGMYTCCQQPLHLNGIPAELGYLGGLRVAPAYRRRLRIVRDGYASIREFSAQLSAKQPPRQWYTAIASENRLARRLLEANLNGMPCYRAVNTMLTMALPTTRGRHHGLWRQARLDEMEDWCRFYNRHASQYQFAPALSPERAARTGAAFYVATGAGGITAVMAMWNQQSHKQVEARAYRWPLDSLLPLYNLYARWMKKVALPPIGHILDQSFLAFFAAEPASDPLKLVADALSLCPTTVLTLGLHTGHPWLDTIVRTFCPAKYQTHIYTVDFGEAIAGAVDLDGRPAQPEVALL